MALLLSVLPVVNRGVRRLGLQGFPVLEAAADEFRPRRHGNLRIDPLGQQSPKLRVVPTQVMPTTIPVRPDSGPEALHLGNQFFLAHIQEIVVLHHPDPL